MNPPGRVGDLNSPVLVSTKTEKFAVTYIIIKNKIVTDSVSPSPSNNNNYNLGTHNHSVTTKILNL